MELSQANKKCKELSEDNKRLMNDLNEIKVLVFLVMLDKLLFILEIFNIHVKDMFIRMNGPNYQCEAGLV